jgi:hypothetical protein
VQGDTVKIDADNATLAGPKVRLQTLSALGGRTVAAKRTSELIETFLKDLGGRASAGDMLSIRNAAMLVAILEDTASRTLAGEAMDVDQLVRLSNAARRAVSALNLPKPTSAAKVRRLLSTWPSVLLRSVRRPRHDRPHNQRRTRGRPHGHDDP